MRVELAYISPRKQRLKSTAIQDLLTDYVGRANRYAPVQVTAYANEAELLSTLDRNAGRTSPFLVLLDSRGDLLTSEQFAARLDALQKDGTQRATLAVGPADGWSTAVQQRAALRLSFGRITLPHELALLVLAEQVYRAWSILAGHPYHGGHT